MAKQQHKKNIGNTHIASLRFPMINIKDIKYFGKSYVNTLNKAIAGKKLTENQSGQLLQIHLLAKDFPVIPNTIILQLIDTYEERLASMVLSEQYENAIEFRDIIQSLKSVSHNTK